MERRPVAWLEADLENAHLLLPQPSGIPSRRFRAGATEAGRHPVLAPSPSPFQRADAKREAEAPPFIHSRVLLHYRPCTWPINVRPFAMVQFHEGARAVRHLQRHVGLQSGATIRTRLDIERAADRFDALSHAIDPRPSAPHFVDDESHAVVDNGERETVGVAARVDSHVLCLTVLERVLQRLLHDAEQT